ncbi:hypothetical protein DCM78_31430 [Bradyrhizobium sp. WBOS04]|nr:hypothetical protein DCM78_31430 [Bradyrhizobium sp. WBOS04]
MPQADHLGAHLPRRARGVDDTISDNEIEIIFDKDKRNYLNVESLKGKVKGSNIVFYDYIQEGKECVYSKIE